MGSHVFTFRILTTVLAGAIYSSALAQSPIVVDFETPTSIGAITAGLSRQSEVGTTNFPNADSASHTGSVTFGIAGINTAPKAATATLADGEIFVDDDWAGLPDGFAIDANKIFNVNAFDTLTSALIAVQPGKTITMFTGSYPEANTVAKAGVHIRAGSTPVLSAPPGSPAGISLLDINAPNVIIDGLSFDIDQTSAVIGVDATLPSNFAGLTVRNCIFTGTGFLNSASSGIRAWGVASGTPITLTSNTVNFAGAPFNILYRGFRLRDVASTITQNVVAGGVQDILYQQATQSSLISNNTLQAAGLDITAPKSGSSLTVVNNTIEPFLSGVFNYGIVVKDNNNGGIVNVQSNTFNGCSNGLYSGGNNNVLVSGNTFNGPAGGDFRHVVLDTAYPPYTTFPTSVPNAFIFVQNTLNGGSPGEGVGLTILNGNPAGQSPDFGSVVIGGGAGSENTFSGDLRLFITLSANVGEEVTQDFNAANNFFGVAGGTKLPGNMTNDERFELEDKIAHKIDYSTLGLVTTVPNFAYVTPSSYLAPLTTYATLQRAIDTVFAGGTVYLTDGVYLGNAQANKPGLSILAGSTPIIEAAPNSAAGQSLIEVSAPNVTINGLTFRVDQTSATIGIRADQAGLGLFNNLTVTSNTFETTGSFTFNTAAVQVFGGGTPQTVTLNSNIVSAGNLLGGEILYRGFRLRGISAVANNNDITAGVQDILIQFTRNTASFNNNTFRGAGVDITNPDPPATSVNIANNTFDPAVTGIFPQSLLIKQNTNTCTINVTNNVFNNHLNGIYTGGSRNVTITGNSFDSSSSPAGYSDIVVDTGWPPSSVAPFVPTSVTIQSNSFNGGSTDGTGIEVRNANAGATSPDFQSVLVGGVGVENTFASTLAKFISLDATIGFEAGVDIDGTNNLYEVSGGTKLPSAMTLQELFELEDKLQHTIDYDQLGRITYNGNNAYVTNDSYVLPATTIANLQRGIAILTTGGNAYMTPGVFEGAVTIIPSNISVFGAQSGVDARGRAAAESIVQSNSTTQHILISGNNTLIDGISATNGVRGIVVGGNAAGTVVQNSIFTNFTRDGVNAFSGTSAIVVRNVFDNIGSTAVAGGNDGNSVTTADDVVTSFAIAYNQVTSTTFAMGGYIQNSVIYKNEITGIAGNVSANAFDFDAANTVIDSNYVTGYTDGGGLTFVGDPERPESTSVTVEHNLFLNNYINAFTTYDATSNGVTLRYNHLGPAGVAGAASFSGPDSLDAAENFWGDSDGPTFVTGLPGAPDGYSAGVIVNPYIGEFSPLNNGFNIGVDDSLVLIDAVDAAGASNVAAVPNAGTGAGRATSLALEPGEPEQGLAGLDQDAIVSKTLHLTTELRDGQFVALLRLAYTDADVAASGVDEDKLALWTWDPLQQVWVPAVTKNTTGTITYKGVSAPTSRLGDFGVDTGNNFVWAVVDHASEYVASPTNLPLPASADLNVVKTDSADPVIVGDSFDYTIEVGNNGPSDATSVTLVDAVPAGLTINSVTPSVGSFTVNGQTVTVDFGTIVDESTETVVINVTATTTGTVTNVATVTADSSDINFVNNADEEQTTIRGPIDANLSVSKTDSADPVTLGDSFTYTLEVTNNGPDAASGVVVTDTVDPLTNLDNVTVTSGTASSVTFDNTGTTVTFASLAVGETVLIELEVSTLSDGTAINTAQIESSTTDSDLLDNSATESTVINPFPLSAELSVTKSDSSDPVNVGDSFSYFINVYNDGIDNATSVTVVDTIDPATSITAVTVSAGPTSDIEFDATGTTVTVPLINLYETVVIQVDVVATSAGLAVNNVTAVGNEPDPFLSNNATSETTQINTIPEADLTITKTDSADPVTLGDNFTYTLEVRNNGPDAASNVVVTDTIDPLTNLDNVTVTSGTASGVTFDNTGTTVTFSSLAAGETVVIELEVSTLGDGTANNTAQVGSDTLDPDSANNDASESTVINPLPLSTDIRVLKFDAADPVQVGDTITYFVEVFNFGPDSATSVTVVDTIDPDTSITAVSITAGPAGDIEFDSTGTTVTIPIVVPFAPSLIQIDAVATSAGLAVNNVSAVGNEPDTDLSNNATSETTQINSIAAADIIITKTDSADPVTLGDSFTYTLEVTNNGPDAAGDVVVTDTIDPLTNLDNVTVTSGTASSVTFDNTGTTVTFASLAVGETVVIELAVSTLSDGTANNVAAVDSDTQDPDENNNTAAESTVINPLPASADVSVTKTDSADPVNVGDSFSWQVTIINSGPDAATSVTVVDVLDAATSITGANIVSGPTGDLEVDASGTTLTIPTLLSQETTILQIDVVAVAPALAVNNATATAVEGDPDLSNNATSETTTINAVVIPEADLSIDKFDNADPVTVGDQITYTVVVTNNGPDDATSVTIVDVIDTALTTLDSATIIGGPSGTVDTDSSGATVTLALLPAGSTSTIELVVTTIADGTATNNVFVDSDTLDNDSSNNTDSEQTVINAPIPVTDVEVAKFISTNPVYPTEETTFTLEVGNIGPDAATGITLTDTLDPTFVPTGSSTTAGSVSITSNVVTLTVAGPVAAGTTVTVTVTGYFTTVGAYTNTASATSTTPDPNLGNNSATIGITVRPFFNVWSDDQFTTPPFNPGGVTGWTALGFQTPGFAIADYNSPETALRGTIVADGTRFRVTGATSNRGEWLPYGVLGSTHIARVKYYVYTADQEEPSAVNTIPALRLRASNRFAVNSMLEVFSHTNDTAAQENLELELRPSQDSLTPSLYRVDVDPVDVPFLFANPGTEGIQRGFEAFSTLPQDNGSINIAESLLGWYPTLATPLSAAPVKTFQTSSSDAGDLQAFIPAGELVLQKLQIPPGEGSFAIVDGTGAQPTYAEDFEGITLDSTGVLQDRVGVGVREFNADGGTGNQAARLRVEEGKQYHVRFHATSTQILTKQAQIRFRARSIKFSYTQKFEVGGSQAAGALTNAIAQQAVPAVGSLNPDKKPGANGGWYDLIIHSPLSREIRPEFSPSTPLSVSMPNISAQPGPGVAAVSQRDLRLGLDVIDTISQSQSANLEQGNVTVDEIQVRTYDRVPD